jgi:S-adenosylmethionine decarboxylase
MSHLTPAGRLPFFIPETDNEPSCSRSGHELGAAISAELGIDALFPAHETTLDSFGFEPCGYSANAVIGSGLSAGGANDGGYFTIHVTPEEGWSYASFECNVPLPAVGKAVPGGRPDLKTLVRQVVDIFQPNRLCITLFASTGDNHEPVPPVVAALDLLPEFERKDRIGYEFEGYDLVFACFERRGWVEPASPVSPGIKAKLAAMSS